MGVDKDNDLRNLRFGSSEAYPRKPIKVDISINQVSDIYGSEKRLRREIARITDQLVLDFLRRMELQGLSFVQLLKYASAIKTFRKSCSKAWLEADDKDLENFLVVMQCLKPKTKRNRWYSLKKFFDYVGNNSFSKFKIKFEKSPLLLPEQVLSREEVDKIIDSATSDRNRVYLSVLYESGCRISELLTIRNKNIRIDEYGILMTVDGKTGQRVIRLVESASLLKEFMGTEPEELVFNINYDNAKKILKETAFKAGIVKKVYPHLLRHSRASHLSPFLTESIMCKVFGWTMGSAMPKIYVHLSARDTDKAILSYYGIEMEEESHEDKLKRMGIG